jgi:hypothetical protein
MNADELFLLLNFDIAKISFFPSIKYLPGKMSCAVPPKHEDPEDANRDNGMITKVWGPPGWLFLHCITFGYPFKIDTTNPEHMQKQRDYRDFFTLIGKVFPCKYCRDSYQNFIKETPIEPHLGSRDALCRWFYTIHNKVNEKLDVPAADIPTFETIQKRYEDYRAKCKKTVAEEEAEKKVKGCVIPADGTRRKCVLNVITNKRMEPAEFENYSLAYRYGDTIGIRINKHVLFAICVAIAAAIAYIATYRTVKITVS